MSPIPPTSNDCGDCTVCCMALKIIELEKVAGRYCQHCVADKGCGIYESRPDVCRAFFCGWRQVPQLGETWRPDRSGILMMMQDIENLPEEHRAAGRGINFVILGGEKAIQKPGFAEYVATLVSRNVAVYLSADTPKTLINQWLRPLAAAKNIPAVQEMLLHLYGLHLQMRADKKLEPPMPWIDVA
jgi:hypothetical protein